MDHGDVPIVATYRSTGRIERDDAIGHTTERQTANMRRFKLINTCETRTGVV